MKKITLFLAFILSLSMFSQEVKEVSLDELLTVNDNSVIFTQLLENNIHYIEDERQEAFKNEIEALAQKKITKAKKYFNKKYSRKDINHIYAEFTQNGRMNFNPKTLSFIREWRSYKREFQKEFKVLFMEYQK
jgi:predicted RecB family endonuclease